MYVRINFNVKQQIFNPAHFSALFRMKVCGINYVKKLLVVQGELKRGEINGKEK